MTFDVVCNSDDGLWDEFEQLGGNDLYGNVLELVHGLLFADPVGRVVCDRGFCDSHDTLPAETSPLHPRNWFNSLVGSSNSWLERTV